MRKSKWLIILGYIIIFFYFVCAKEVNAVKSCVPHSKAILGAVNEDLLLQSEIELSQGDTILKRYIYNGFYWQVAASYHNFSSYDIVRIKSSFPQTKDYVYAGGWIYKDKNGDTKSIICPSYVRIFNKKTISFPAPKLYFPDNYREPYHQVISDNNQYIGAVYYENQSSPAWTGDNKGYVPYFGSFINDWRLFGDLITKDIYAVSYFRSGAWENYWPKKEIAFINYPKDLPTKLDFWVKAPYYRLDSGEINKPEATPLFFENLTIYSRSTPRNWVSGPPPLPVAKNNFQPINPKPNISPGPVPPLDPPIIKKTNIIPITNTSSQIKTYNLKTTN